jgi:hypothetical protein
VDRAGRRPAILLVLAGYIAGFVLGRYIDHRLELAIAEADRDDPYWRIDDVLAHRQPVADAENSALVLAKARPLLPESWPIVPYKERATARITWIIAKSVFDQMTATADNVRLGDSAVGVLRAELTACAEGVRLARNIANRRRGRYEIVLGPMLTDTPLPQTMEARCTAQLLAADAAIRAHDADFDGALESCCASLAAGRSLGDEPFLISQLIRVSIGQTALAASLRVLGQGEPSDAALARLQSLLLDEMDQPLMRYGLRGERAMFVELHRRLASGEVSLAELAGKRPTFHTRGSRAAIDPWMKLYWDSQHLVTLEWMNAGVAIERQPHSARRAQWAAWEARARQAEQGRFGRVLAAALRTLPAMQQASGLITRYQAGLGAMTVLFAAERHRRKQGEWPSSVAAIDRGILPNPPIDPFSGGPFRMERRDGRLLVYSAGPKSKDDDGVFGVLPWLKGGADDCVAAAWDVRLRRQPPPPDEEPTTPE